MYDRYNYVVTPNKVIALSTYAGKAVRGIAKCSPRDEFDEEYGKELAAARCNAKVAAKRLKRARRLYDEAADAWLQAEMSLRKYSAYLEKAARDAAAADKYLAIIEQAGEGDL